ncbi:MAG: Abi family protein [Spirochaetaceae bacterium]|nr:Abi family protein [Spirochaetaceae bacterium]
MYEKYNDIVNRFEEKPTYSSSILIKYFSKMPIWALVEVLSFSEFLKLHEFYYSKKAKTNYKSYNSKIENFAWSIKIIRNACAHNNCILNSLKNRNENYNFQLLTELSKMKISLTTSEKDKLKLCVVNDIVLIIVFFNKIITSEKFHCQNLIFKIKILN